MLNKNDQLTLIGDSLHSLELVTSNIDDHFKFHQHTRAKVWSRLPTIKIQIIKDSMSVSFGPFSQGQLVLILPDISYVKKYVRRIVPCIYLEKSI